MQGLRALDLGFEICMFGAFGLERLAYHLAYPQGFSAEG